MRTRGGDKGDARQRFDLGIAYVDLAGLADADSGRAAIQAAVAPLAARLDQGDAERQAERVVDAVKAAATPLLHDVSDALQIDLTAVIDSAWEERAQIDLEFHLVAKEVQSIPTYGTFPISVSTESSTTSREVTAP